MTRKAQAPPHRRAMKRRITTPRPWQAFELAVAKFVAALDPHAVVKHSASIPDVDTNRRRQRDVWIEAKIGGFFPVRVLVSCKRWRARLDVSDIEAFVGELSGSGAHKGVIYAYGGFTGPALEKAEVRGICCCKLYRNDPPDIPDVLFFKSYCCAPRVSINVSWRRTASLPWPIDTWQALFDLPMNDGQTESVLDRIVSSFLEGEDAALRKVTSGEVFPSDFEVEFAVPDRGDGIGQLTIAARGSWRFYEARLEAYLVDGSYSFTSKDFRGSIATPWIDRLGDHPGPGWTPILERPTMGSGNITCVVLSRGDVRSALIAGMGAKMLDA